MLDRISYCVVLEVLIFSFLKKVKIKTSHIFSVMQIVFLVIL
jgi:hypothetical protein